MVIFNTDLDNTIIFSYKHDIGNDKKCVEIYQGREISFITARTSQLLRAVNDSVLLVPTTTRTQEQYHRIDLGIGTPKYALVCNGGVLLTDGEEDEKWYEESYRLAENCQDELSRAEGILENDKHRTFEIRNIRKLFVFTKSEEPMVSVENLKNNLNTDKVDVFSTGVKVYVVPKKLSKGVAINRLRKKLGADLVIAAGDSEFDISMLEAADIAIAPEELSQLSALPNGTYLMKGEKIFSEQVLESVIDIQRHSGIISPQAIFSPELPLG